MNPLAKIMAMSSFQTESSQNGILRLASRNAPILFILVYFIFQIFFLTAISNGAGSDDSEQLVYIGALQWGYGGSQPPLYTWINSLAGSTLGISMFTIYLVKFSMIASMFLSVYFGARLLDLPKLTATAGALGLFLLPQIAWESQRTLTHSVGGTAGCAWAFLAFAWHMKSRSWLSAGVLGLAIAAGVLGKFNAVFFMAALILAGLSIPAYRSVLLSRKSFLTVMTLIVAIAPTSLWAIGHTENLLARTHKFEMDGSGGFFISRLHGIWRLASNAVLFSGVSLGIFALIWWKVRNGPKPFARHWMNGEVLVIRILLFALSLVLVTVVLSGAAEVKDRWLQPVLFLGPLGLSILLQRQTPAVQYLRGFAVAGVICALVVVPALAVNRLYARHGKVPTIGQLDYARLFEVTRAQGYYKTVVSTGPQLPGNLRLFDTSINPVHREMPNAASRIKLPALIVWFGNGPSETMAKLLARAGLSAPPAIHHIKLGYKYYPDTTRSISFVIVTK
jgi:4-amino-4-deoxy-L-arabinose transferase-like glycosyltransferase